MSIMKIRGHRNQKGFTLVELMVVLVIIAILVAIAIPIYNNTKTNAERRACQANLRTIDGAIAQYQAEVGTAPTTIDQLVTGGYLKAAPKCPSGGTYSISNGAVACSKATDLGHTYP